MFIARINAFGGESEIEIFPAFQAAALFQQRPDQLFRSAGVRCGLQNDDGSASEIFGNGDCGISDIADVRLLVLVQRGRHADSDKIHIPDKIKVIGSAQHSGRDRFFKVRAHNVPDVILALIDHIDFFPLHVKADGAKPMLCLFHSQRQPDITQAAYAHCQSVISDFREQFLTNTHDDCPPACSIWALPYLRPQARQTHSAGSSYRRCPHSHTYPITLAGTPAISA